MEIGYVNLLKPTIQQKPQSKALCLYVTHLSLSSHENLV